MPPPSFALRPSVPRRPSPSPAPVPESAPTRTWKGSRAEPCACGLDRVGILLARDDLPGKRQHQVVAVVPVGGETILGEFALDGEGALQLLRHQLQGVRLQEAGLAVSRPDAPLRPDRRRTAPACGERGSEPAGAAAHAAAHGALAAPAAGAPRRRCGHLPPDRRDRRSRLAAALPLVPGDAHGRRRRAGGRAQRLRRCDRGRRPSARPSPSGSGGCARDRGREQSHNIATERIEAVGSDIPLPRSPRLALRRLRDCRNAARRRAFAEAPNPHRRSDRGYPATVATAVPAQRPGSAAQTGDRHRAWPRSANSADCAPSNGATGPALARRGRRPHNIRPSDPQSQAGTEMAPTGKCLASQRPSWTTRAAAPAVLAALQRWRGRPSFGGAA